MSETSNVENSNQREIVSNNSFAETPSESVTIPEPSVSETHTESAPTEVNGEANEGELPEFAKRRLGKEQKKYERELGRLRAELEAERSRQSAPQQQPASYNPGNAFYLDPLTGEHIDTSTAEGQQLLRDRQKISQHLTAQENAQQERNQKEVQAKLSAHFQDSFEDAHEKYPDFEKTMKSSGINPAIAWELATFPDPGELGYYIASNPREVERLQRLPAYELKREMARHMADMVKKNNITNAPAPIKPVGTGAANPVKHFAHKTIAELKAERRAQLAGKSRR